MTPLTSTNETQATQTDGFRARPGVRVLLVVSFLLLIYGVPFMEAGVEIIRGDTPRFFSVFTRFPNQVNLRSYEHGLEDSSVFGTATRRWVKYVWFNLFRYAGEKV